MEPLYWPIVLGGLSLVLLPALFKLFTRWIVKAILRKTRLRKTAPPMDPPDEPSGEPLPYRRVASLLSPAERRFYSVLIEAKEAGQTIFSKVRLADLVEVPQESANYLTHFRKVSQKHVDFVICEGSSLVPVAVVELDDASHNTARARRADGVKDRALAAAGLPIVRIRAARQYDPAAIASELAEVSRPPVVFEQVNA
ncbi:DUF2726 domain-containing protein [Alienimonas chondri]|uniref:DUF2726 domain-containing protein n=1 Tax=Alienimonas chondri TaxID=2681879 RepID=UPI0014877E13|nr:DUF2726 domain-containing protein [Alienimonas chondri]